MKLALKALYFIFSIIFLIYLGAKDLPFPKPPRGAFQSVEPADSETPLRRAYFTNFTRQEVLLHYQDQFKLTFFGFDIPSYKLIYPPEDAYVLIRDQTRSTHLEEIVYPFRESLYINEFVPKVAKDDIWYKGAHYEQKITVSIKQTNLWVRLVIGLATLVEIYVFSGQFVKSSIKLFSQLHRLVYIIKK